MIWLYILGWSVAWFGGYCWRASKESDKEEPPSYRFRP